MEIYTTTPMSIRAYNNYGVIFCINNCMWIININHRLGLTSLNMIHERRDSTSGFITPIPKETCQNSNHQEPVGSTSRRITFVLKKIRNVQTQNKITSSSISNMYETEITKKYNSLHRKYVYITKLHRHKMQQQYNPHNFTNLISLSSIII